MQRIMLYRRLMGSLIGALLGCAAMPLAVAALKTPPPTVVYYDLDGSSRAELREQLSRLGPRDPISRRIYQGSSEWGYEISYGLREEADECAVDWVDMQISATITLPRWTRLEAAPPELRQRWMAFAEAMKRHEYGHYEFGLLMGEELQAAVEGMRSGGGCKVLRKEIDGLSRKLLRKYRELDREYEQRTAHGSEAGVVL